MLPLLAHCHLGLGQECDCTNDGGQAREHLVEAARLYRTMGMPLWMDEAETMLHRLRPLL